MKKYLIIGIIFFPVVFLSCSKKDDPGPVAEFSFTADGVPYSFPGNFYAQKGSLLFRDYWFASQPVNKYVLQGTDTYLTYLLVDIFTNDLKAATYSVSMRAALNNVYYDSSANCTIVIRSLENNLASGSFSGEVFTNGRSAKPIIIANGKFSNVQVKL